jgi:hypothetical protein
MAEFVFEVQGASEINERISALSRSQLKIIFNEGLRAIGRLFVPAKGTGPLADATPYRTGAGRRSTVFQVVGGPEDQRLEIRQGAKSPEGVFYLYIVREGRGPIKAIRAKALHFWIGGQEFFRKSVGPAAPNPYHLRVLTMLMPQVQEIVNAMGRNVVAYMSGQGEIGKRG